jgi:hypothetical protein
MSLSAKITNDYRDRLTSATYSFAGVNNMVDPYNLPIEKGFLVKAENVDIDNTSSASLRSGYTQYIATTSAHSAWSDGNRAFFVDNGYLKTLYAGAATIINVVNQNLKMWYVKANDVVVYSNGETSGIYGGELTQTSTYSPYFKEETQIGICLEFYNGRLYHAIDNSVYCSDTYDIEHSDVRYKNVATFNSRVTMIRKVEDGLYIGTETNTYFLRGNDITGEGFELDILCDYGVVIGTDIATQSEYMPQVQGSGRVMLWLSTRGICSGQNGGKWMNHSVNVFSFPEHREGNALVRDFNGMRQYIVTARGASAAYNKNNDAQTASII